MMGTRLLSPSALALLPGGVAASVAIGSDSRLPPGLASTTISVSVASTVLLALCGLMLAWSMTITFTKYTPSDGGPTANRKVGLCSLLCSCWPWSPVATWPNSSNTCQKYPYSPRPPLTEALARKPLLGCASSYRLMDTVMFGTLVNGVPGEPVAPTMSTVVSIVLVGTGVVLSVTVSTTL